MGSVYAKHLTHVHNIKILQCPIVDFIEYLRKEIESRKEKGDQIILMRDIKKYILSHNISRFMANLGLKEMITSKNGGQGPGTTRTNKKGQEIYCIWDSQGIIISQVGYLPLHDVTNSYHRLLWIKISHKIAFGGGKYLYRAPSIRKLRLEHIIDQSKYTSKLRLLTRKNNLLQLLRDLDHLQTFTP